MPFVYVTTDCNRRDGRLRQGRRRCAIAMNFLDDGGSALPSSFPPALTTPVVADPLEATAGFLTASCGACTPVPRGATFPSTSALGRPSTVDFVAGAATA